MISLCIVGAGAIATCHMEAFRALGGVYPRWVVSRTEEEAHQFAKTWTFEREGSQLDAALADPRVELVVIASPSDLHADQAARALRADKHVILEIPAAMNLPEVESLARLSVERRRRLLVCHTMRSFKAIREVQRRVQQGELHLTQIAGHFAIPRRRNQGMGGRERRWIDNLLWHHACHFVDTALWVLGIGQAEHVSAMFGRPHPQFGMAMDFSIHFRTASRQLVTHALTYNTEQFCSELRFIGDEDVLTYRNGRLVNEKNEQLFPETSILDLVPQNKQMLATITEGAPSDYDINSVLPAMRVLQQAQLSAQT